MQGVLSSYVLVLSWSATVMSSLMTAGGDDTDKKDFDGAAYEALFAVLGWLGCRNTTSTDESAPVGRAAYAAVAAVAASDADADAAWAISLVNRYRQTSTEGFLLL
jgi:hypothetical protein